MPKKCSAETIKSDKPSPAKRAASEIDQIFADRKKRKAEKENEANTVDMMKNKKRKKKNDNKGEVRVDKGGRFGDDKGKVRVEKLGGSGDETFQPRRKTGDGLKIYREEELGIANPNSGGTRLCPFDCDCCF